VWGITRAAYRDIAKVRAAARCVGALAGVGSLPMSSRSRSRRDRWGFSSSLGSTLRVVRIA